MTMNRQLPLGVDNYRRLTQSLTPDLKVKSLDYRWLTGPNATKMMAAILKAYIKVRASLS